jgi:hypothetical protein
MMAVERAVSLETRRAMFRAAVVAQCAGETNVTANRILAALLRADTLTELCSRAHIDSALVMKAVEDPETLSFEECERRVRSELAGNGVAFGSREHQAAIQYRPLDPVVRPVLDRTFQRHGHVAVSPLELLLDLIRADPAMAERLATHGLDATVISAGLEER